MALGNTLLAVYVLLACIGLIALGAAALAAVVFLAWTAWPLIGMGVAFIVALAAARNTMPVLPHLGTGLIRIVALVEAVGGG